MVLATDPSRHFTDLAKFKSMFTSRKIEESNKSHLLDMLMHAADISNPSRPWKLCQKWADLVLQEFFNQGDREKDMGLPVSYLCDRDQVVVGKSQTGFIDVIVKPTFEAVAVLAHEIHHNVKNIETNRRNWEEYDNPDKQVESPRRLMNQQTDRKNTIPTTP
jgi:hypothetical protein